LQPDILAQNFEHPVDAMDEIEAILNS